MFEDGEQVTAGGRRDGRLPRRHRCKGTGGAATDDVDDQRDSRGTDGTYTEQNQNIDLYAVLLAGGKCTLSRADVSRNRSTVRTGTHRAVIQLDQLTTGIVRLRCANRSGGVDMTKHGAINTPNNVKMAKSFIKVTTSSLGNRTVRNNITSGFSKSNRTKWIPVLTCIHTLTVN